MYKSESIITYESNRNKVVFIYQKFGWRLVSSRKSNIVKALNYELFFEENEGTEQNKEKEEARQQYNSYLNLLNTAYEENYNANKSRLKYRRKFKIALFGFLFGYWILIFPIVFFFQGIKGMSREKKVMEESADRMDQAESMIERFMIKYDRMNKQKNDDDLNIKQTSVEKNKFQEIMDQQFVKQPKQNTPSQTKIIKVTCDMCKRELKGETKYIVSVDEERETICEQCLINLKKSGKEIDIISQSKA